MWAATCRDFCSAFQDGVRRVPSQVTRKPLLVALPHLLLLLGLCLLSGLATCRHDRPHPLGLEGSWG